MIGGVVASAATNGSTGPAKDHPVKKSDDSGGAVKHDVSPALRDIAVSPEPDQKPKKPKKEHELPLPPQAAPAPDPALQSQLGGAAAPALGKSFEGLGQGFTGPAGTFNVNSAPPDTNGDIGPNHYVQIVNQSFAVFNKNGTPVFGPAPTNTLWSGFGGGCQNNDDGDATVVYDRAADRWVFQQFSVSSAPYLECVAVSTTPDPTGTYFRYSFQYANFPDYPKLGVWPDAYYVTLNLFSGNTFLGPEMCAWDRARMLQGLSATQQCFTLGTNDGGLLPADQDSAAAPPAGSPNPMVEFGTNNLLLWHFHVDWTTPANSTFTGPTTLAVAPFTAACGGGACIPQLGVSQRLDSLGDRVMYRLAYRNFGDHESLVVNHSITAGSSVGVRWYELRDPNGAPTVYQQGTYAPDSTYRWMGSAAMDGSGDVALGFSTSSSSVRPGIHYTAHLTTDPLGVMGQGEGVVIDGTGSQAGFGLDRWGDYSSLNVDPTDDCTFWYTNEYLASTGAFNWHTRVGTFTLPGCGTPATPDYSVSATPSSRTVTQGQGTTYNVTITPTGGFAGQVNLSVSGLPTGANGTFNPNPTASTSTLTVTTSAATPAGSYPLTITGTSGALSHQTTVTLVVQAPAGDFTLGATPASRTVTRRSSTTYAVTITPVNGFSGSVSLSVSGLPSGATASFSPNPATSSSTLTVSTKQRTPRGTFTLTITGTSGGLTHTKTVTLVVQ
jgi:hypothetical protein